MAGATNIRIGATTTDFVAAMRAASAATGQFVADFQQNFGKLKGSVDEPAGAFRALSREAAATKKQIEDLAAVGAKIPESLLQKYSLLKGSIDSINGSFKIQTPDLTPFNKLNATLNQTEQEIKDIVVAGGKVPRELTQKFKTLSEQVNKANEAIGKRPDTGFISSLKGDLLSLGASYLSIQGAVSLFTKALEDTTQIQKINIALKTVSASTEEYAKAQQFTLSLAQSLGLEYGSLANSYNKVLAATQGTALAGKQTEDIFASIARTSAALQLSTEETEGVLKALVDMISKGTVQAEELKGQLGDRLPGAFRLFAEAIGVSTEQLAKMLENGEVMANDTLPKFARKLDETFGSKSQSNVNTMTGAMNRLKTETMLFFAEFTKASGIDETFTAITRGVADTLQGLREVVKSKEWSTFFAAVSGVLPGMGAIGNAANLRISQLGKQTAELDLFKSMPLEKQVAKIGVLQDELTRLNKIANPEKKSLFWLDNLVPSAEQERAKNRIAEITTLLSSMNKLRFDGFVNNLKTGIDNFTSPQKKIDALRISIAALNREKDAKNTSQGRKLAIEAEIKSATQQLTNLESKLKSAPQTSYFEKLKKDAQTLETKLADMLAKGVTPPASEFAKLRQLQAQLNDITSKLNPTKVKSARLTVKVEARTDLSSLKNLAERIQGEIDTEFLQTNNLNNGKIEFVKVIRQQIDELETIARDGRRIKLPDLAEIIGQGIINAPAVLKRYKDFTQQVKNLFTGDLPNLKENQEKWGKQLKEFNESIINAFDNTDITQGIYAKLGGGSLLEAVNKSLITSQQGQEIFQKMKEVSDLISNGSKELAAAVTSGFFESVGSSLAGGEGLKKFFKSTFDLLASYVKQLGTALVKTGIFQLFTPITAAMGAKNIAIGGLMIAGSSAIANLVGGIKVPKLAEGGIVYSNSIVNVAEYSGARNNPEVIAPLSKLKSMLGDQAVYIPETKIRGQDIYVAYHRAAEYYGEVKGGRRA